MGRLLVRLARGGVSLTVTLAVSISLLVLVAVVVVLGLGLVSGARNTMALLHDKSELFVSSIVQRVRSHLEPAQQQLEFIENLVAEGALDPMDQERMVTMMTGSLAGVVGFSYRCYLVEVVENSCRDICIELEIKNNS